MNKLDKFQDEIIVFVETQQVKDGVEADLYSFSDDSSKDLAIVRVKAGYKTPLQRILKGKETVEGYVEGKGTLTVTSPNGSHIINTYPGDSAAETSVAIGDTMQWSAETDLAFYEICWPPYEDGRFENIA